MTKLVLLFQLISLKTAPVAVADQFSILPADLAGMGGVQIAVRDALADPWTNPAKGARLDGARFLTSPTIYSVSRNSGAGRTLPLGFLGRSGAWFGGLMIGLQQVDPAKGSPFFPPPFVTGVRDAVLPPFAQPVPDHPHGNSYAAATTGLALGGGWSAGIAGRWAGLTGMDGVDQLYAGATALAQHGHDLDLRAGVLHDAGRDAGSIEAVVVAHRYDMTHNVTWTDSWWDPASRSFVPVLRVDHNRDVTNTLGAMLAGVRPLRNGWRIGASATVNRLTHPEIPDYVIQSVPRDPGRSWAADFGVGIAHTGGPTRFAVDAVLEPAASHTWNDTHTVDNRFSFTNAMLRMGFARGFDLGAAGHALELQLGLAATSIGYTLDQQDHAAATSRSDTESWVEWTPTWGLSLRFPDLEIRYAGSTTNGTGRPFTQTFCCVPVLANTPGPSILVTPNGPLSLANVSVVTHQVSIAVPLR